MAEPCAAIAPAVISGRKRVQPQIVGDSKRLDSKSCPANAPVAADERHLERPVLRLRERCGEGVDEILFEFQNTPASEVRRVDSQQELRALLALQAARAAKTSEHWVRQPHRRWIAELAGELLPVQRERLAERQARLRTSLLPEEDFGGRWMETADLAGFVLHLWFEDRSLEQVLARAEQLGHMGPDGLPGCVLEGEYARKMSASRDVSFGGLLPMVRRMSARDDGLLSVYKVCAHNCFDQEQEHASLPEELSPDDGQGSLNTTWDFALDPGGCGVDLVDEFYEQADASLRGCEAVRLNRRMYLIWKFQNYVTSYHQDTHVPPHFTIYNQVSGYSLFHFLPLLVGLYATHVGRRDPRELERVLGELDRRGIGSLGTLGPGRVALILPFGSHGVWVPSTKHNPSLRPFQVSLIRAVELYVQPLLDRIRESMRGRQWNRAMELTPAEKSQVRAFAEAQEELRREMGLSRAKWAWLASVTWEAWNKEGPEREAPAW